MLINRRRRQLRELMRTAKTVMALVGFTIFLVLPIREQAANARNVAAVTPSGSPKPASISPSKGPTAGGTHVTITGKGFQAGARVTFGSAAATSVTVQSSTQITATTPARPAGVVNVTVTNSNGQSASLNSAFTFVSPPTLSSISPLAVPPQGALT